jgi:hypothetical protein
MKGIAFQKQGSFQVLCELQVLYQDALREEFPA